MATKADKERWIAEAQRKNARYIVVACDSFEYDEYPIYCKDGLEKNKTCDSVNAKQMQYVMEIIEVRK